MKNREEINAIMSVKVVDCGDYSEVVIEDTPFAKIGFDVLSVYFS